MDRILNTIKYCIKINDIWLGFRSRTGPLIQVKITKKDKRGTATGWVGGHSGHSVGGHRGFQRWPPNTGNKYSVFV